MLVLTRRKGEEVVIEGGITVTVVSAKGGTIRLGISAPTSVRVDRREVHQRRVEFMEGTEHRQQVPKSVRGRGAVRGGTPAKLSQRTNLENC